MRSMDFLFAWGSRLYKSLTEECTIENFWYMSESECLIKQIM